MMRNLQEAKACWEMRLLQSEGWAGALSPLMKKVLNIPKSLAHRVADLL